MPLPIRNLTHNPTKQVYSPYPFPGSSQEPGEISGVASPHWRRGLRLQLKWAVYWDGQIGVGVCADSDNGIHPRRPSSYRFEACEIPSIESPIMSHNTARPARLLENKTQHSNCLYFYW
jgi:hypothetical protein